MPAFEKNKDRYQAAVLWEYVGHDRYGEAVVGDPTEIRVRWVGTETEMVAADGSTVTFDASAIVDRKIPLESHMWEGELHNWTGTGSGVGDEKIYVVKAYNEASDIKNRHHRRSVGLMRLRGTKITGSDEV